LETERDPTRDLREQLSFLNDNVRHDVLFLVREFASIMEAFFRGQLLIGLIMGLLLAIGFSLVGLEFGLLLGLLLGLLNIIPYLGTILGLASALPIAFFQPDGGLTTAGLTLLIFVIVQALEGYLLTPKIIGRQTGLHPFVVIVAIFFWGAALDGLLGMVLAIPLTAFFIVAWRMLRRNYLDRLRTD
jgi:predicted PurR-regulated permease PerM